MGTKAFDNYADLITFTRASGGTALRPVSYGAELVTNGDGSDTTGWVAVAASFSSDGSVFTVTDTDGSIGYVDRLTSGFTSGSVYQVSIDVTTDVVTPSGRFYLQVGTSSGAGQLVDLQLDSVLSPSGTGTATAIFVATSTSHYVGVRNEDVSAGQSWSFDNISVKEVLFDQPDGTLTLFNHPDNIPRIEYDADGNRLGLLIEEQRTNLIDYSEDVSLSDGGGGTGVDVSRPVISTIFGTRASDLAASDNNSNGFTTSRYVSGASGTTYTATFWLKNNNSTQTRLQIRNTSTAAEANISWSGQTPTVSNVTGSFTAEHYGDGLYRIHVTYTAVETVQRLRVYPDTVSGTNSVYILAQQLEQGSFPTSYIPTSGSTATRAADVASIPVADFGYNQKQGTVVVECATFIPASQTNGLMWQATDGTSINRIEFGQVGSGDAYPRVSGLLRVNNVTTGTFLCQTSWVPDGSSFEAVGFAYKSGSSILDTTTDDTPSIGSGTIPSGITTVRFAHKGYIKSIKYYPRRLTNAQLVEITS